MNYTNGRIVVAEEIEHVGRLIGRFPKGPYIWWRHALIPSDQAITVVKALQSAAIRNRRSKLQLNMDRLFETTEVRGLHRPLLDSESKYAKKNPMLDSESNIPKRPEVIHNASCLYRRVMANSNRWMRNCSITLTGLDLLGSADLWWRTVQDIYEYNRIKVSLSISVRERIYQICLIFSTLNIPLIFNR